MAKVTIQDVARVAGVSVATVDRVLNRRPGVRSVTVNKVENAIRDLNYQPDRIAARLQADGFAKGDKTAIAGLNSVEQMAVILGTLRAGGVAGLITNSATGEQMAAMIADTGARTAKDLLVEVDGRSRIAGLWFLNVPPFPAS